MRKSMFLAAVVALGFVWAYPASAQTLEERRMHATREASLAHAAELTDKKCGTHLKTGFDWSSFDAEQALKQDPTAWCTAALDAMEDLCDDPMGKEAVSGEIKTLTCGGAAAPEVSLDADGTVKFLFSMTPNQNKLLVRDYLNKHL